MVGLALTKMFQDHLCKLGVGLEHKLSMKIGLLSGGQRQAVAMLMATLQASNLLLLDEHTAALDPKMADKIMKLTNDLVRENNLTTLMITHNLSYALEYGDRIIIMKDGKITNNFNKEEKEKLTLNMLKNML